MDDFEYTWNLGEEEQSRKGCAFCGEDNPCNTEHCAYKDDE